MILTVGPAVVAPDGDGSTFFRIFANWKTIFGSEMPHITGGWDQYLCFGQRLEDWGAVDTALMRAGLELEYGWCDDHNAPWGSGVSPYAINSQNGNRVSTNDGYLDPVRGRKNLTIEGNAIVDTLTFEGNRHHVNGVKVCLNGELQNIRANREVLLCAGAIHSPTILQIFWIWSGFVLITLVFRLLTNYRLVKIC